MALDLNAISGAIVDRSLRIHRALGPGLLESVYHQILEYELRKAGFHVKSQVPIPVVWDGNAFAESFRADLIVNSQVLVELKSTEVTQKLYQKQVLTYIKLADIRLGLLINFGSRLLKDGIHRVANGMPERRAAES